MENQMDDDVNLNVQIEAVTKYLNETSRNATHFLITLFHCTSNMDKDLFKSIKRKTWLYLNDLNTEHVLNINGYESLTVNIKWNTVDIFTGPLYFTQTILSDSVVKNITDSVLSRICTEVSKDLNNHNWSISSIYLRNISIDTDFYGSITVGSSSYGGELDSKGNSKS